MKQNRFFFPTELIFAPTSQCNMRCPHCFTNKEPLRLPVDDAKRLIESCVGSSIEKIGFSGGEPFLDMDFLAEIIPFAAQRGFLFDRIMTNGDWWKNKSELDEKLRAVYDAGFDGKIGLSWDSFHGQDYGRICTFIKAVIEIWDGYSLEIQSVVAPADRAETGDAFIGKLHALAEELSCRFEYTADKKTGNGTAILESETVFIPVRRGKQSFQSENENAWKSRRWFTDDFCAGPGNILFVHPDGAVVPCCGFANENSGLHIGMVRDTFQQIMENARANAMVRLCFTDGLKSRMKTLKKRGVIFPGKTDDICTFCDFVCKWDAQDSGGD